MTFDAGTRLGQYEIIAVLGAGGMGEVYRARDTKLGREVAIKVLREEFSKDKERVARFEREAKLLASLNHPAIATLYGFEDDYLVMELVEGETLAARIARGPIPIDEALPLFVQIAEGLEAAHEKGVIHRDLKPGNVMITPDGKPKILDFGLAKAFSPERDVSAETSQSPTLTKGTALGVIMGTAAYMSPEQAKGKVVDRRADIWAFGCVLFEALTGRRVFGGDDVSETLASVLRDESPWADLPASLPWRVRELLEQCLQKNARERLHDIGDGRLQIEKAQREPGKLEAASMGGRQALPWGLAVTGFVAALAGWLWNPTTPSSDRAVARLTIPLAVGEHVALDTIRSSIALSPDGQRLVYVANRASQRQLFVRDLDESEAKGLAGTEGATTPFFSPDGRWVGFFSGVTLKKVSPAGGTPVPLAVVPPVNRGASWGLNDAIYLTASPNGGIASLLGDPENSDERAVANGSWGPIALPQPSSGQLSFRWPDVLPSGKGVLFTLDTGAGFDNARISVLDLETGQITPLVDGGTYARYVRSGHIVFARDGSLLAIPFHDERLEVYGEPVQVVDGVATDQEGAAHFSVSVNGTLAFVSGDVWDSSRRLVWVDRRGGVDPLPAPPRAYLQPSLSPDGRRIAVTIADGSNTDIWLSEVARGTLTRITSHPGEDFNAVWSPDGNRVVFSSEVASPEGGLRGPSLAVAAADGSGNLERLIDGQRPGVEFAGSFHPDGETLAFSFWRQGVPVSASTGMEMRLLPLDERQEAPLLETPFNEHSPMFSPDGRWIAYVSDETGREEVYLRAHPGEGGKYPISTEGGAEPVWAPSGDELFYRNGDQMIAVTVVTEPDLVRGTPQVLFEGNFAVTYRPDTPRNYDVSRDGQRFLMVQSVGESTRSEINVVLNWVEEPKRLVPTGN